MQTPLPYEASWYAVSTRSRQEKIAASMLNYLAVANFLPLINQERRWSDRKQTVSLPLFPGYFFVRTVRTGDVLLRVLRVPGIVDFVRDRNGPVAIAESEIESVRRALALPIGCSPYPFLTAGDRVRVVRGALEGIEGAFIRGGSQSKLVISVEMIQRSVAVCVAESDVEPISCVAKEQLQSIPEFFQTQEGCA